ncbi:hypothetical protein [Marispirochaeta sp.]|uniref:hypothetical protein n=1 Tax=Marispirochaeta sp. TaxID=2038653 RepID=UPI0029C82F14|nr:hypothetical protein [Marispirochaeta sp.]
MKERIGEYFIGIQMLSLEHIEKIMEYQSDNPGLKFGEIAIKLGYLDQRDVDEYLDMDKE